MTRRALLLPVLAVVHIGVMVAVLRAPPPDIMPVTAAALVIVAVPESPITPEVLPPPPATEPIASIDAPTIEIADAGPVTAGPCALTADVETALRQSAAIPGAIVRIPAAARSVSNALLLWDGAWMRAEPIGGAAALGPIRQVVTDRILAAPPACRDVAITGPRLLVVPDGAGAIVLAFGSGRWRWSELVAS